MSNRSDYLNMTTSNKYILEEMLCSQNVTATIKENLNTLLHIIPEIEPTIGFDHKHPHHHLDVWEHTLCALSYAPIDYDVRLSILLHDIGKPHSFITIRGVNHYPGHGAVSAQMTTNILTRLNYDQKYINEISTMVEMHDKEITLIDMDTNLPLAKKLFEVQKCDVYAHNPEKNEKRNAYLKRTEELFLQHQNSIVESEATPTN